MLSNIFDAHAHYDDGWFDEDRDSVLGNLPDKGVCGVVNNSVDLDNAKRVIALAEKYDYMYAAVGVHPENLENLPDDYLDRITELTKHPKVVAVGETGLDYHWDIPREEQKRVFEEQLGLSLDLKMPIIEAVRMGLYISLGGVVTFKNARHSVEVASEIPLDRLLLETDAPYMAPVPFRGKRCDSSMIVFAAEKIAQLRNMTAQQVLDITTENAKRFYSIK